MSPVKQPPPPTTTITTHLFLTENKKISKWIEYQPKSKEKYKSFLHCISSFEGTPLKICKIQPPDLLFLVVFTFTSADTTFHKNLENAKWKVKNTKIGKI